jgi:hypothetical protein
MSNWNSTPQGKEYMRKYHQEHLERAREQSRNYRRETRVTLKDGKQIQIDNKPRRPDNICQLCGDTREVIAYHHWDDNYPHCGVWVCVPCHKGCEMFEKGLIDKYVSMKEKFMESE